MFLFYMYLCLACMYVCVSCVCLRTEEGIGSLRTVVTGGFESPNGCWGSDLGPLEKRPVLITTMNYVSILESLAGGGSSKLYI